MGSDWPVYHRSAWLPSLMPCQSLGKLSCNSWFHVWVVPVHLYNSIKSALRISPVCFNLISIYLAMPAIWIGRCTPQALRSFLNQYIHHGQLIWPAWCVNLAFFSRGPSFSNAWLCSVTCISSTSLFHLLPHMGTIAKNTCLTLIFC